MFLSISRFRVGNDLEGAVRDAFLARPHRVDEAAGFVRMEVANPSEDPALKGLRLDPTRTWQGQFDVFAT